jgi:general secretion pathway protein C
MGVLDKLDAARLLRRLGVRDALGLAEILIVAVLAVLVARLLWALVQPLGPLGSPAAAGGTRAGIDTSVLARFDPFFAAPGPSGPIVVSDLDLDLFGTRVDNVSGRGSAILSADGGPQRSYGVGDELLPGVLLHAVAFDSVTISRGGALEQLFLDQSVPATPVGQTGQTGQAGQTTPAAPPVLDVNRLAAELDTAPVLANGRVDGVALTAVGDSQLLNELGLQAGDVILSVNRARIDTPARAEGLAGLLGDSKVAEIEIRRGAQVRTYRYEIAR